MDRLSRTIFASTPFQASYTLRSLNGRRSLLSSPYVYLCSSCPFRRIYALSCSVCCDSRKSPFFFRPLQVGCSLSVAWPNMIMVSSSWAVRAPRQIRAGNLFIV